MTCQRCVRHVTSALRQVPGVASAQVDLASGVATIEHDDQVVVAQLCGAVDDAGYQATPELVS
jgi:copper chaperone CopZ